MATGKELSVNIQCTYRKLQKPHFIYLNGIYQFKYLTAMGQNEQYQITKIIESNLIHSSAEVLKELCTFVKSSSKGPVSFVSTSK